MKIRLKGQSIRIRVNQKEIEEFALNGILREEVYFKAGADGKFVFELRRMNCEGLKTNSDANSINILVPETMALKWVETEEVGMEAFYEFDDDKGINILIEKDFHCLIERDGGEDEDAFPNPLA